MWERQIREAERHQKLRDKKMLSLKPITIEFNTAKVIPAMDASMRSLCVKPYPNHPKGCPNYGYRLTCPPTVQLFTEVIDQHYPIWAMWATFGLGAHVERLRIKHPNWTYRQLSCCLYWQGTVRKFLRKEIAVKFPSTEADPGLKVVTCPEAMGVNVTATMETIGVTLEWPPKEYTRMVYLVGVTQ